MAEHFLEEQLRRIQQMTEQMARARHRAAELSEEIERNRALDEANPSPQEVRDFRTYTSVESTPDHAEEHGGRSIPRSPSRSRRK